MDSNVQTRKIVLEANKGTAMKKKMFGDQKLCIKFLKEISHSPNKKRKNNEVKPRKRIPRNLSKDSLFSYTREFEGPEYQIISSR